MRGARVQGGQGLEGWLLGQVLGRGQVLACLHAFTGSKATL